MPAGILKAWTILVYMAAASPDLSPYAYLHLHEMEAAFADPAMTAASTPSADVVVALDLGADPSRRIHVVRADVPYAPDRCLAPPGCSLGDIHSPVVDTVDDQDRPPAERLQRFLEWGMAKYPSRHVLVVISAHGQGYRPAGAPDDAFGGLVFSTHPRVVLDLPAVRAAIAGASRDQRAGRPVDIQGFDACLMQSVEVAAEVAPASRYLVGSEQVDAYLGFPWRTLIPRLNGAAPPPPIAARCPPADVACDAAALIPTLARDAYAPGGLYAAAALRARETMTLSAVSTAAIDGALAPALRDLSTAIEAYLREDELRRIDLAAILGDLPGFLGDTRDLGLFLEKIRALALRDIATPGARRLLRAVDAVRAALDKSVIAAALGDRYAAPAYAGMAGISMWLPRDAATANERLDFMARSRLYAIAPEIRGWISPLFDLTPARSAARTAAPAPPAP